MSLLDAIASLSTADTETAGAYTVTRTAEGTATLGRYTVGGASTFTIDAVVQPLDARSMTPLPSGVRSEDVRLLHTATALRTRDNAGEADRVSIGGETFAVWKVDGPWTLGGETHYEVHVARRGQP